MTSATSEIRNSLSCVGRVSPPPFAFGQRRGRLFRLVRNQPSASVPEARAFLHVVQTILASSQPVYIHCAQGHGRSAIVVAAVLIAKGLASDVESAERLIRERRPSVKLNRRQREFVRANTEVQS